MQAQIVAGLVQALVAILGQSKLFVTIEDGVHRWEARALAGAEKKAGLLAELEVDGIKLAGWILDTLIQLAVVKVRTAQGKIP